MPDEETGFGSMSAQPWPVAMPTSRTKAGGNSSVVSCNSREQNDTASFCSDSGADQLPCSSRANCPCRAYTEYVWICRSKMKKRYSTDHSTGVEIMTGKSFAK